MEKLPSNTYLALVFNHEKESVVRVANQFVQCFDIQAEPHEPPKKLSFKINQKMKENHLQTWLKKPQHGATHLCLKKSSFSSHVRGYSPAIQEEEISTRSLQSKHLTDEHINLSCRLCGNQKETIQHIIVLCPNLSTSMYLPLQHNKFANVIYQNIVPKEEKKCRQPI